MNIDMIEAARERIGNNVRCTPFLNSPAFDKLASRRVWVKAECLQYTNSFKIRGAWSAVSALAPNRRKSGVIGHSSGNHGQALSFTARAFDIPALVIMPSDAPTLKIDKTREFGAEVILYDRDLDDREELGSKIAQERGMTLIKPFDDNHVIAGQGTTGLEIAEQAAEHGITDADVLVCCGGGGLLAGLALAFEAHAPTLRTRPVEPHDFNDVTRSLLSRKIESNTQKSGSICDAILTPCPGQLTWPIIQRLCGSGLVVSDREALQAIVLGNEYFRFIAEPGGAVSLAAALFRRDQIHSDDVICVVTGGNIDNQLFQKAMDQFGAKT
ncbi:MAG: threonine/serine dehydratase [Aestuariivita sp.]|nr:threonine/serine dehydratase [Aestuariivita sp.]MCY4201469.1 threonine/serine dehydratase [Aestuariivita sp.]